MALFKLVKKFNLMTLQSDYWSTYMEESSLGKLGFQLNARGDFLLAFSGPLT